MHLKVDDLVLISFSDYYNNDIKFLSVVIECYDDCTFLTDLHSFMGRDLLESWKLSAVNSSYIKVLKNYGDISLKEFRKQYPEEFI